MKYSEPHPSTQSFNQLNSAGELLKIHIGRNCNFTLLNLKLQLENGFDKVDASTCKKIISRIKNREDKFWNDDMLFDLSV
jgi:hypothetical protein